MDRMAESDDEDLVRRSREGDGTAFDDIVLRYRKDVYRVAYRLTGDHGEADDLAQETFCRAFTGLRGFRGECSLRTWLCRIATNLSLNVVQSARVTRRETTAVETLVDRNRATVAPPVGTDDLERRRRGALLRRAIESLPRRQRMALILRVFEGLRFKEVADAMGCSIGAAKAHFFLAVSALRRRMKDMA